MRHLLQGLLLLLLPLAGGAQGLPALVPHGVYNDDDRAAHAFSPGPGGRAQFRQRINASIQKNPRNATALVHRAYLFMEGGDPGRARRDYDAALAVVEPGTEYERDVLWSRGWASYEQGDYAATHADWQRAVTLHGGRPFWVDHSLALLYWTTGQYDLALQWYDAAVAGNADWGTADGMATRTRHWSATQQAHAQAMFARWSSSRPAADAGGDASAR